MIPDYSSGKTFKVQGTKISLPFHIESSENLKIFKSLMKTWNSCGYTVCLK